MVDEKIILSQISNLKKNAKSENGDYLSGYFSALSTIEGTIAGQPKISIKENEICTDLRCPNREMNRS